MVTFFLRYDTDFDRNRLIKWLMRHRTRVGNKMSALGNDLAIRGRRHDNTYTDDMESELFIKAKTASTYEERLRATEGLYNLHARNNDYYPEFHKGGLSDMNMAQIIELICERMALYEETILENGNTILSIEPDRYYEFVLLGFPEDMPDIIKDIVRNTIDYIVDKNSVIKKMIEKREAMYRGETERLNKLAEKKREDMYRGEATEE